MVSTRYAAHYYREPSQSDQVNKVFTANAIEFPTQYTQSLISGRIGDCMKQLTASITEKSEELPKLKLRVTHLEHAVENPARWELAQRVVSTALLILAYAVLAVSLVGIPVICVLECNDTFDKTAIGDAWHLAHDRQRLSQLETSLKTEQSDKTTIDNFKAKTPAHIAALETKLDSLRKSHANVLANPTGFQPEWNNILQNELHWHAFALKAIRA